MERVRCGWYSVSKRISRACKYLIWNTRKKMKETCSFSISFSSLWSNLKQLPDDHNLLKVCFTLAELYLEDHWDSIRGDFTEPQQYPVLSWRQPEGTTGAATMGEEHSSIYRDGLWIVHWTRCFQALSETWATLCKSSAGQTNFWIVTVTSSCKPRQTGPEQEREMPSAGSLSLHGRTCPQLPWAQDTSNLLEMG